MNITLEIIGIACFAVLFAEESGVLNWLKYNIIFKNDTTAYISKRIKPFDCPLCLAWWMGIIYGLINHYGPVSVLIGAICSILATTISKFLRK